jgi:hypothetical protein
MSGPPDATPWCINCRAWLGEAIVDASPSPARKSSSSVCDAWRERLPPPSSRTPPIAGAWPTLHATRRGRPVTWNKVADDFYAHPKVAGLDLRAVGLWTKALSWCGRYLTDGRVPLDMIDPLAGMPRGRAMALARKLVAAKLWEPVGDGSGYQFHDYLEHNLSKHEHDTFRDTRRRAAQIGGACAIARRRRSAYRTAIRIAYHVAMRPHRRRQCAERASFCARRRRSTRRSLKATSASRSPTMAQCEACGGPIRRGKCAECGAVAAHEYVPCQCGPPATGAGLGAAAPRPDRGRESLGATGPHAELIAAFVAAGAAPVRNVRRVPVCGASGADTGGDHRGRPRRHRPAARAASGPGGMSAHEGA